jgi:FkbM family methyltransferase
VSAFAGIKRVGEQVWYGRGKNRFTDVPIPWRLPYGGWFMAHGDAMGARVVGYHFANHPYEEDQWQFVASWLHSGMVFFDVGANQGFYAILASRAVGAAGRVYAFEPAPTEHRKLARNLRLNRCSNVVAEVSAVGAGAGTTEFHLALGHQGSWSSLRRPADDLTTRTALIQVNLVSLDAYAAAHGIERLDMLKIDVEGGELDVLKGAEACLRDLRPVVLCEVEDRRTRQFGYRARQIIDHLRERDYEVMTAGRNGKLVNAGLREAYEWENVVAFPAGRAAEIGGSSRC